jgi:hypothetical protein
MSATFQRPAVKRPTPCIVWNAAVALHPERIIAAVDRPVQRQGVL